MRYAIVIEKAANNYAAYVPDLPGCVATGKTVQETEQQIREAIEFHLEGMREDGLPIPEPSSQVEYVEIGTETHSNFVTIGGVVDRVKVSLRVFGDDFNPNEITRILRCEPTKKTVKGEVIVGKFSGHQRVSKHSSWILKSDEDESVELEEQIIKLLGRVSYELTVWEDIGSRFSIDLFCGLFLKKENRYCSLSVDTLKMLADRRIKIMFDIYYV